MVLSLSSHHQLDKGAIWLIFYSFSLLSQWVPLFTVDVIGLRIRYPIFKCKIKRSWICWWYYLTWGDLDNLHKVEVSLYVFESLFGALVKYWNKLTWNSSTISMDSTRYPNSRLRLHNKHWLIILESSSTPRNDA